MGSVGVSSARTVPPAPAGSGSDLNLTTGDSEQSGLALVTSTAADGLGTFTWTLTDPLGVNRDALLSATDTASVTWTPDLWGVWKAKCTDGTVTLTHVVETGVLDVDLSTLTLSNDGGGLIASETATDLNFAAVTGSNAGEDWPYWEIEDLVPNTYYEVTVRDTAPATDRRGIGIGWRDDNIMACVGFFNSASARECFSASGSNSGPTEDLIEFSNASMTTVRSGFYVTADSKLQLQMNVVGTNDDNEGLASQARGTAATLTALSNGKLTAFTRRGTNNGTCTMGYSIKVRKRSGHTP